MFGKTAPYPQPQRAALPLYIQSGQVQVWGGKLSEAPGANEFVYVPVGAAFAIEAVGGDSSVLVFQTPR